MYGVLRTKSTIGTCNTHGRGSVYSGVSSRNHDAAPRCAANPPRVNAPRMRDAFALDRQQPCLLFQLFGLMDTQRVTYKMGLRVLRMWWQPYRNWSLHLSGEVGGFT